MCLGCLANQMVGAITASGIGSIRDPNNPALIGILLGDNQRGGAFPLFVRLVYPTGTESEYYPLHVTLTRGATSITTARRSAIVNGEGGRVADYEVVAEGGISVGTWPDGFASIGQDITVELLFEAPPEPPAPTPAHSFSIVAGTNSGFIGYWDGRAGSITDGQYKLSNGQNGRIRQFMRGGSIPTGRVRFLFNGNRAADLFPDRIVATNGSNEVTLVPPDPRTTGSYGQGTGIDYIGTQADIAAVFVNGATVTADIFYD